MPVDHCRGCSSSLGWCRTRSRSDPGRVVGFIFFLFPPFYLHILGTRSQESLPLLLPTPGTSCRRNFGKPKRIFSSCDLQLGGPAPQFTFCKQNFYLFYFFPLSGFPFLNITPDRTPESQLCLSELFKFILGRSCCGAGVPEHFLAGTWKII